MSSSQIHLESTSIISPPSLAPEESNWYAVHIMARHEKRVAAQFEEKRVCTFLPLLHQVHRWSDRRSVVEIPMFSCYAFVRMVQTVEERLKILRTPGVLGFVGSERQGTFDSGRTDREPQESDKRENSVFATSFRQCREARSHSRGIS